LGGLSRSLRRIERHAGEQEARRAHDSENLHGLLRRVAGIERILAVTELRQVSGASWGSARIGAKRADMVMPNERCSWMSANSLPLRRCEIDQEGEKEDRGDEEQSQRFHIGRQIVWAWVIFEHGGRLITGSEIHGNLQMMIRWDCWHSAGFRSASGAQRADPPACCQ
jgi:hypothetical protein